MIKIGNEDIPIKIDKQFTLEIGGIKQLMQIKTDNSDKPVLLFLAGGPGSSMIDNADCFTDILKDKFTIVQWDQRDAGKTLEMNPSPVQPSLRQMEDDTYQVINFLIEKLNQKKIYLLGSSWGNVLGFYIVKNHPELLYSYFAVNPVITQSASEKELLKTLKKLYRHDTLAQEELNSVHIPFKTGEDLFYLRKWLFYKDGIQDVKSNEFKTGFLEWSKKWLPVWNEVMEIDLTKILKKADCPIYFFVGKNDIQASARISKKYFKELKAPKKQLYLFNYSAHQIHQDEPENFQKQIIKTLDNQ